MNTPSTIYGEVIGDPFAEVLAGAQNLGHLVTRAAARWPAKVAWRFDDTQQNYTFSEIAEFTSSIAELLMGRGVGPGSKVAVHAGNTPEFPLTWLALARLGAVMVPINTSYRLADAGHVLKHSGADVIVASKPSEELARSLVAESMGKLDLLLLDVTSLARAAAGSLVLDQSALDSTTNIQYTSGTTGLPKGCLLGNDYWLSLAASLVTDTPSLRHEDVLLTAQPFHYIDPQWNVAAALLVGAEMVILDRFHPSSFWTRVREYKVTYFYCLGLMPTLLLKMPTSELDKQHCVRAISASAIPPHLHEDLESRWGTPWYESFGMTETGADLYVSGHEHDELLGSGSLGRPRRHRQAAVVDQTGASVAPGTVGQLLLRGAGLFKGYFENSEATATALNDGWFATGDLVHADAQGRLYYAGRTKDMIRRSGENISAVEVEAVLEQHGQIHMAAVVSVPDELRGEEVLAFIVPTDPTGPVTELLATVGKYCSDQLAYFKIPRYWRVCTELPMTPSERVAKQKLLTGNPLDGAWDRVTGTLLATAKELA